MPFSNYHSEGRQAGHNLHLDIDGQRLDALERNRGDTLNHAGSPLASARSLARPRVVDKNISGTSSDRSPTASGRYPDCPKQLPDCLKQVRDRVRLRRHFLAPAFRVTVEGEPRPLHPILRDDIYKIATEALRNAFWHAQATDVEVEIRYDRQQFRLRVQDDGKGFDEALLPRQADAGHYGVPGMRERAALMGATLTVWSKEGAGTAVELCIPSRNAYVKPRERRWFSRAFTLSSDS